MSMFSAIYDFISNNVLLCIVVLFCVLRLVKGKAGPMEEYPGNKVISIHSEQEWQDILATSAKEKKLVVVDFFATWCGPCRYAAPIYGKMSTEFENVIFVKVDVDEMRSISQNNNVRAMPTFQFFKNGKRVESVTGWSESRVRNMIETHK